LENFNKWLKRRKPGIVTGLMWAGVGIAGFIYIIYHEYGKRMKK